MLKEQRVYNFFPFLMRVSTCCMRFDFTSEWLKTLLTNKLGCPFSLNVQVISSVHSVIKAAASTNSFQ